MSYVSEYYPAHTFPEWKRPETLAAWLAERQDLQKEGFEAFDYANTGGTRSVAAASLAGLLTSWFLGGLMMLAQHKFAALPFFIGLLGSALCISVLVSRAKASRLFWSNPKQLREVMLQEAPEESVWANAEARVAYLALKKSEVPVLVGDVIDLRRRFKVPAEENLGVVWIAFVYGITSFGLLLGLTAALLH